MATVTSRPPARDIWDTVNPPRVFDQSAMLTSCRCGINNVISKQSTHWASYQICKISGSACAGNAGNVSPPPQVSDPDMHHGMCVTHVPWYMPGSLTSGSLWSVAGKNIPGISGACATRNCTYLVRGPLRCVLIEPQLLPGRGLSICNVSEQPLLGDL